VNLEHISLGRWDRFGSVLCFSEKRRPEVRSALLVACGFNRNFE
jgi:hypothetical protein